MVFWFYSNYKTCTFISPDIYIERNSKLVLDSMNCESDIKIISYPWYFLSQYFMPGKRSLLTLKDVDIPVTNHAILFTGIPRMNRSYILSELSKEKNLLWSSVGAVRELKNNPTKIVNEYELYDNRFTLNVEGQTILRDYDDMVDDCFFVEPRFFKYNPDLYLHKLREGDDTLFDKHVPIEFLESAVYFACESQTVAAGIVTEKTIKGLFYKKPFLIYSVKGYHKWLKDNGFELYD